MNDNEYLAGIIYEHLESGTPLVMVSILSLKGSSPRHAGTKMVLSPKGIFGTVGGSLLEAKAIEMSRIVLDQKESRLINYDLDGTNAYSKGMICGGKATLLLDFIDPADENRNYFQTWQEAVKSGSDFYFLTQISETGTDDKVKIIGRGLLSLEGHLLGKSEIAPNDLDNLKPELHTISSTAIFALKNGQLLVDFIRRLKTLYCFGAGHVALPTAQVASLAGFSVVVIDDRAEFANPERFPDAEVQVIKDYHHAMEGLKIDEDSFIVIVTRGHQYDRTVLEQALQTHAGYIGMISSRRKREAIYNALIENGVTRQALEQVHSPIGLDIGAETPEEIAVSIVAELILERSKQQAQKMNRKAAILLAGGFSSRMGSFKPLLRLGEETITDRAISLFVQNDVDVLLVTGWQKDKLASGIKNRDIRIIENPDFEQGMFTLVQAGLRHLKGDYTALFILPVDIPLVRPFTVRRMLEASECLPGKILYPVFNRMRGHPPLIPTGLIPHILNWQNDGGLVAALAPYENIVEEIIVPDENISFDVDTPEDYKVALDRFQRYEIPTDEECQVILTDICQVDPPRRRHCFKVAEVAARISQTLIEAGKTVDEGLVRASAFLHDIVREKPQHDIVGGQLLCQMGFEKVGRIVAVHTFLLSELTENYLEARVVYLADKFVQGDTVVTLEARFDSAHQKYGATPEIENKIASRCKHALVIKKELETMIGKPLESIIFK